MYGWKLTASAVLATMIPPLRLLWAGLRSFVPDRRPVVGAWPDHPGFWFVAGQGGSGIETAPALSAFAAAVVTGSTPPADIPLDPADLAPVRTASRLLSGG